MATTATTINKVCKFKYTKTPEISKHNHLLAHLSLQSCSCALHFACSPGLIVLSLQPISSLLINKPLSVGILDRLLLIILEVRCFIVLRASCYRWLLSLVISEQTQACNESERDGQGEKTPSDVCLEINLVPASERPREYHVAYRGRL